MPRKPSDAIKRALALLWNTAHRVARRAGELACAVRHGWFGRCEVCGRVGPWLYRPAVIPLRLIELSGLSKAQADALRREGDAGVLLVQGKAARSRRLARVILARYPTKKGVSSLKDWVVQPEIRALAIAEINTIDGIHRFVRGLPNLAFSDYHDALLPGETAESTRHEDLTQLSYPDGSFDLVLTSESLEHVPDLSAALGEILRVLKPGGYHIFTIPVFPGVVKTYARTIVHADGALEHRAPRICHPWGDYGWPVFTEFGADLPEVLRDAGFDTEIEFGPTRDDDLAQVYVCRKPE